MEVILLQRIESLGQMGDVVNVKPGFARNYLLPQKKALRATDDNRRQFEERRAQLEADNLDRRTDAESVADKMDDVTVFLQRQAGDAGQLYGSVSARDIAAAVTEAGYTVNRSQVQLDRPIKAIGLHTVRVDLHPEQVQARGYHASVVSPTIPRACVLAAGITRPVDLPHPPTGQVEDVDAAPAWLCAVATGCQVGVLHAGCVAPASTACEG